jgi:aryl-alcohol dehydrogenase-like predicted oxidoreductase
VRAAFAGALECGVTVFDTAELYARGESERLLGRCIRESGAAVMVATRFFPYPWRLFRRGWVLQALNASLQRLGCEYVALYQVHWPLPLLPPTLWVNELAEAVRQGLTQAVGVSNFSAKQLRGVLPVLHELGARHDKTPAQVALNWLLCKGAVPIPGAKSNKQARENAGALGWRLGPDEIERLDRIA